MICLPVEQNCSETVDVRGDGSAAACIEIVLPGAVTICVNDGASRETLIDVLAAVRKASA